MPGVCEENKKNYVEEKNKCPLKFFAVEGSTLEGCIRTEMPPIQLELDTRIVHNIKVLVM